MSFPKSLTPSELRAVGYALSARNSYLNALSLLDQELGRTIAGRTIKTVTNRYAQDILFEARLSDGMVEESLECQDLFLDCLSRFPTLRSEIRLHRLSPGISSTNEE